MAENVVINGTTYPEVEAVALDNGNGEKTVFYPDAVRYNAQALTEAQKEQAKKNIGLAVVPEYVVTEAKAVIDKVMTAQGSRTFVLAAITDMHYGSSDYTAGVIHAAQGLKHIADRIKLDALAALGDYTDEHQTDTSTAVTDREECNALLAMVDADRLCMKGNHDHTPGLDAQIYRSIMANSDGVVWGSRVGGYFYRDFEAYKLRVICLNTTENTRDNLFVSDAQYQWFANMLDLSAKGDAGEWGILILSHHPLDWTVTNGNYRFGPILNAYQSGASWTDGAVSCNYDGKNAAAIVANIHGHIHNLLTDYIYVGAPGASAQTDVLRIATPAARVDFVNHYSGVWVEDVWYNKTQNTAEDTSFCVYCIDLDAHTIKAICYGAGYDRSLNYTVPGQPKYTNLLDVYDVTFDKRFATAGPADCVGMCLFHIPSTVAYGKTLRFKGILTGPDTATSNGKGFNSVTVTDGNSTTISNYTFSDSIYGGETNRIFATNHIVDEGNGVYAIALTDATLSLPSAFVGSGKYFTVGIVLNRTGTATSAADLDGIIVTLDQKIE